MKPTLLVIAGPNGAGKTTITVKLRTEKWSDDVEYLNPDDVARERFGDWNSPQASLDAARWTSTRRKIYGPLPDWVAEVVDALPRHADFVDLRVG